MMPMTRHRSVGDTERYTGREKLEENEVSGNDIPWQSIGNEFASHRVYDIWLEDVDKQKPQHAGNVKLQFNVPRLVNGSAKLEKGTSAPDITEYEEMSSLLTNDYQGNTLPLTRKVNSRAYNWRPKMDIYTAARNQISDQRERERGRVYCNKVM